MPPATICPVDFRLSQDYFPNRPFRDKSLPLAFSGYAGVISFCVSAARGNLKYRSFIVHCRLSTFRSNAGGLKMKLSNDNAPQLSFSCRVGMCEWQGSAARTGLWRVGVLPVDNLIFVPKERCDLDHLDYVGRVGIDQSGASILAESNGVDAQAVRRNLDFIMQSFRKRRQRSSHQSNKVVSEGFDMNTRCDIGKVATVGKITGAIQAGRGAMPIGSIGSGVISGTVGYQGIGMFFVSRLGVFLSEAFENRYLAIFRLLRCHILASVPSSPERPQSFNSPNASGVRRVGFFIVGLWSLMRSRFSLLGPSAIEPEGAKE